MGGLNSTLLNGSATPVPPPLLRERQPRGLHHAHHRRGAERGDIAKLKEALRQSKGPWQLRNLLLYTRGSRDGVKLIPVAEVAAKDDFLSIKNVSRDDQLASHRVPPN